MMERLDRPTSGEARRALRIAIAILAAWALSAAASAWQQNDLAVRRGDPSEYGLRLIETAAPMLLWALLTPLLLYVGHRFPIRKPHRVRNTLLVCAAAAGVTFLRAVADVMLMVTYHGVLASLAGLFHVHAPYAVGILGIATFIRLEEDEKIRRHTIARSEAAAAEAVLRQLRADLSPHFLFNTLNALATLLHEDPRKAERMLDQIRDFLRNLMATEHAREVCLAEELEIVSSYFELQMMRFGAKLTATIEVADPGLRDAAIPPLLLQPLIENAIIHGITPRRDGGCVTVRVDREIEPAGTWLRIDVLDDGPGFDLESGGGKQRVGLANVATRLQAIYGSAHALRHLRIGEWFVARLLIPLNIRERW